VTSGGTTTTNFSLASEATISYAYDEASHLAAVVDSLNSSVVYNYDAAGNIQSITKTPPAQSRSATLCQIVDQSEPP